MFGKGDILVLPLRQSMSIRRFFGLIRILLVGIGLSLFAAGIDTVASMPQAPPTSDGFPQGLGYLFSLVLGVSGLLVVQIGYAFPVGIGRFRGGPLVDHSAGARSGVVVVVYFMTALFMVYVIPALFSSVTGSPTYITGFLVFVFATVSGLGLTFLLTFGGLLIPAYDRRDDSDERK